MADGAAYSFGKTPPRSLRGTGIAGLLGSGSTVFYDNLFSPACLGRVSDLFVSKLRDYGTDELRIRAVLLFSFFEAYRAQIGSVSSSNPLMIECGVDDEKIGIGVTFQLPEDHDFDPNGVSERVATGEVLTVFEVLLAAIYRQADHLVLRYDPVSLNAEVIALLAIPEQMEVGEKQPLTIVLPEADAESVKAEAEEYIQLGDLDYAGLLKEKHPGAPKKETKPAGPELAQSFEADEERVEMVRISGSEPPKEEPSLRISGEKFEEDKTELRVKSLAQEEQPETVVSSVESAQLDEKALEEKVMLFKCGQIPEFTDGDLRGMTQFLIAAINGTDFGSSSEQLQQKAQFMQLVKDISSTVRQKEHEFKSREQGLTEDVRRRDDQIQQKTNAMAHLKEQLSQASAQIGKYREAQRAVKSEQVTEDGGQGFKDKYEQSARMVNALRDKNTALSQKIDELRERINNSTRPGSGASDEQVRDLAALKVKHEQLQRQFSQAKSQNEQLLRRVQQSQDKQAAERAESAKNAKGGNADELKRKLDTNLRLTGAQQREIEKLRAKLEEYAQEANRLKAELNKSQGDLRATKSALEKIQRAAPPETKKAG